MTTGNLTRLQPESREEQNKKILIQIRQAQRLVFFLGAVEIFLQMDDAQDLLDYASRFLSYFTIPGITNGAAFQELCQKLRSYKKEDYDFYDNKLLEYFGLLDKLIDHLEDSLIE